MSRFPGWKRSTHNVVWALADVESVDFVASDAGVWSVQVGMTVYGVRIVVIMTIEQARDADIITEVR